MPTDIRQLAAALANDHTRRAFALLTLGSDEQAILDALGPSSGAKAIQTLRRAGLIEPDAAIVRPAVFREMLAELDDGTRPSGVDRFVNGGRIDSFPARADDFEAVLGWARDRAIPIETRLTEAQVNDRLAAVFGDTALLRRYLVDAALLRRTPDGAAYSRPRDAGAPWGRLPWSAGRWTHEPVASRESGAALEVTAAEGSDAWRTTAYGFVHDTEHALVAPLQHGTAVEVGFLAAFDEQFDQGGIFARLDENNWIKAGVEFADGVPQVGAVVTRGVSDWSVAPVPEWAGREVTIRASWDADALTIRARADDEAWRLVRVVPLEPEATASAGPFVCAPTRAGLTVRFTRWSVGEVDAALH